MANNLIIVESPNKIKTIKSYLSDDYEVLATYGHLREMDKRYGYNQNTFEPNWSIIEERTGVSKAKLIENIRKVANKAKVIYLATDPDREGEAIAWHVYDLLDDEDKNKCHRITFNEITKKAIVNSIENAHELDMNLVYSQFARRVIDRLIGYKLSSFVRSTVYGKSAGRVQSVALMFIVNRQLERNAFVPSKWYEVNATLDNGLALSFYDKDGRYEKYTESESNPHRFKFLNEKEANEVFNSLSEQFKFLSYSEPKITNGDKLQPLTTDKLLQLAGNNLGWSASKTTLVAQKLFEGVDVNGEHLAYITYPRTDSTRINDDFINDAQEFLINKYGQDFVVSHYVAKKKKKNDDNIQDAHEAIRPIDPTITPEDIKSLVDDASYRLYNLIWSRTMACLMNQPVYQTTGLYFSNNQHHFYGSVKQIKHPGYLLLDFYKKVYAQYDQQVPNFVKNDEYHGVASMQEFDKQPPPYFTQASLIAALKDSGVGRPSTYATMAKIGETRGYVYENNQKLIPTEMGMKVIEELNKDFNDVINTRFTSQMEDNLDKIAEGDEIWTAYLNEFAPKFEEKIKQILKEQKEEKIKNQVKVGRQCPECGSELVIKESRFGTKFVACSGFPKCRYAEFEKQDNSTGEQCPECGGNLVKRYSKTGNQFIGCSSFPNCRYIKKESLE